MTESVSRRHCLSLIPIVGNMSVQNISNKIFNKIVILLLMLQLCACGTQKSPLKISSTLLPPGSTPELQPTAKPTTVPSAIPTDSPGYGHDKPSCKYLPASKLNYSANDCIPMVESPFLYGSNPGYYPKNNDYGQGSLWSDLQLAKLNADMGMKTYRPAMFERFMTENGDNVRTDTFRQYVDTQGTLKLQDLVLFISGGWDPYEDPLRDPARENRLYSDAHGSCPAKSASFKGIYEPIWNASGQVNENNKFAMFISRVLQNYGLYIKYLEVWNEPDLPAGSELVGYDYDYAGNRNSEKSWYDRAPSPCELRNLFASPYHYIRMLRITYELVKKYNILVADSSKYILVTTGGIGIPSFLDFILRSSDNPDNGKITPDFPHTGGAYIDVISFHHYPFFQTWEVDPVEGYPKPIEGKTTETASNRHSDGYIKTSVSLYKMLKKIMLKYGYDNVQKPAKYFMLTEIGVPDVPWQMDGSKLLEGGVSLQQNILAKVLVKMQQLGLLSVDLYKLGSHVDPGTTLLPGVWSETQGGLWASFGLYNNLTTKGPGQESLTHLGIMMKTICTQLQDYVYDEHQTQKLLLDSHIDGAAFRKGSSYRYVLWAKTTTDKIEFARSSYDFPATIFKNNTLLKRFNLNSSIANSSNSEKSTGIVLSETPSIFY